MNNNDNLQAVLKNIIDVKKCSHTPNQPIEIVAASKSQSVDNILNCYQQGIRHFGENYLQEALLKQQELKRQPIIWHYIGKIQTKKCRQLATSFNWIQSLDRLDHAVRLSRYANDENKILNICLQVNIDNEPQKGGIEISEINLLCAAIKDLKGLKLRGFMVLPKPEHNKDDMIRKFRYIYQLFQTYKDSFGLDTLSMGMSKDYRLAIQEGATMVRIGTALFGPREK